MSFAEDKVLVAVLVPRVVVPFLTPEGREVDEASLEVSEEATLLLAATFDSKKMITKVQSIDTQGQDT